MPLTDNSCRNPFSCRRSRILIGVAVTLVIGLVGLFATQGVGADSRQLPELADDRPVIGIQHQGPIRVVYHISRGEMKNGVGKGLFYLRKLHEGYLKAGIDPQRLDIRAVYHGQASEDLLTDEAWNRERNVTTGNPNTPLLTELVRRGVHVELCNNRRIENRWSKSDIHPDVLLVGGAYQRLIDLQLQDYAYIRFWISSNTLAHNHFGELIMTNPSSSESRNPQTPAGPRCVGCGPCKGLGVLLALLGLGLFAAGFLVGPNNAELEKIQPAAESSSAPAGEVSKENAPLTWRDNFDAALEESAAVDRPVLLRFTAEWCLPCQVMDKNVFPNENVQSALRSAIPVKIDMDQSGSREVALRYGVRGIPTMVLVDAQGQELARGGFMSAEALVEFLKEV